VPAPKPQVQTPVLKKKKRKIMRFSFQEKKNGPRHWQCILEMACIHLTNISRTNYMPDTHQALAQQAAPATTSLSGAKWK
jgi:hypothetical protein